MQKNTIAKILSDQIKINNMKGLIKSGGILKSTAEFLLKKQGVKAPIFK